MADDRLPPELAAQLAALAAMPDDQIDTSDIPEVVDWSGAVRGGLGSIEPKALLWLGAMAKANGYLAPTPVPGDRYAVVSQFAFTVGVLVGDLFDDYGYNDRYCYETLSVALRALVEWRNRGFEGEPIGWHRETRTARRRPGGDPTKEYVNP